MTLLVLGLLVFLGTHAFTMARGARAGLIGRLGPGGYRILYSLLSLLGLALIAVGFSRYRAAGYIQVWDPPAALRHLSLLLVFVAFAIFPAAYLPGHIKAALKHPMLASVKIWALAHLLANGDLGSILLFGSVLAWAVMARISAKHREPAPDAMAGPPGLRNDVLAVAIGSVAYVVFLVWLHPLLIGVPVLPTQA